MSLVTSLSADDDGHGDRAAKKAARDASKKKRKLDTETPGKAKKKPKAACTVDVNRVRERRRWPSSGTQVERRGPSASEALWVHESPQKVTDLAGHEADGDAESSPLPCVWLTAPAALHAWSVST